MLFDLKATHDGRINLNEIIFMERFDGRIHFWIKSGAILKVHYSDRSKRDEMFKIINNKINGQNI